MGTVTRGVTRSVTRSMSNIGGWGGHDADLSLLYQFDKTGSLNATDGLGPTLGITRTTTASYWNSAGILSTAASGAARFDHNPITGESLGLLVEEARTNICLYSEDLSNAAWVASNVTKGSTSVAAPDGTANTTVRLTASAANGTVLQTVTSASATRAYAVFMKRVTGTGDIDLTVDGGATWTTKTLTAAWTRFDITQAAVTDPQFGVRIVTSGDAIDFWGAQLEAGAFPTSYIPTVASSVTRNIDIVSTPDLSWYSVTGGTMYSFASKYASTVTGIVWQLDDGGSTNDRMFSYANGGVDAYFLAREGAVTQAFFQDTDDDYASEASVRQVITIVENDAEQYVNGTRTGTGDQIVVVPITIDNLRIGHRSGGLDAWSGHIKELRYYKVRKPNAFLADLSNGIIEA